MHDYFYGWYFRCQGREGTVAVIPAVHVSGPKRSCSVQIITADGAWSREFPIAQFRIDRSKMIIITITVYDYTTNATTKSTIKRH